MTATETGLLVGTSVLRREDGPLLTGQGTYVDNIQLPGTVHLVVVRSPYAHARIRSVDLEAARAAKGVVAAFSGADPLEASAWIYAHDADADLPGERE